MTILRQPTTRTETRTERRRSPWKLDAAALRTWHTHVSMFVAPMILFYALSGCLQILDLHEAHGNYVPSPLLSSIGRLHKDQVFAPAPVKKPPPARTQSPGAPSAPPPKAEALPLQTQAIKVLFLAEALAFVVTALFGIVIGLTHARRSKRSAVVLGLGFLVPLILVAL